LLPNYSPKVLIWEQIDCRFVRGCHEMVSERYAAALAS
jgi:hypothetical protein